VFDRPSGGPYCTEPPCESKNKGRMESATTDDLSSGVIGESVVTAATAAAGRMNVEELSHLPTPSNDLSPGVVGESVVATATEAAGAANGEESSNLPSNDLTASIVAESVAARIKSLEESSNLPPPSSDLIYLEWDDVFMEDMLGVGGFASVCLATCPKLWGKQDRAGDLTENSFSMNSYDVSWAHSDASFYSGASLMSIDESSTTLKGAYAVKSLSNRTMSDQKQYVTGACDLASEAFLLSRLSHHNIIQLYAVTAGDVAEAFTKQGGFFLVLEALDTTLTKELDAWRNMPLPLIDDFVTKCSQRSNRNSVPSTRDRLDIATDIAKGMLYLHNNNIVFRDLKPDNVGIDKAGQVRLFDFGLAREVKGSHVKGVAGSTMYLAPETIMGKFSCKASDVFSFGILCWELMSLQRPYPEFKKPSQLQKAVCIDGHRPDLSSVADGVDAFISSCWQADHEARPSFGGVIASLVNLKQFRTPKRVIPET